MLEYIILMLFIIGAFIGMYIFIKSKNTHRVLIKEAGKTTNSTKIYWMSEVLNRNDKSKRWKSWPFPELYILPPPSEAIEFLPNGKKVASGYLIGKDQVAWITDKIDQENQKIVEQISRNSLTNSQRSILVNEYEKSEDERLKKKNLTDIIMQYTPMLILAIVIIVVVLYATDIYQAQKESTLAQAEITKAQADVANMQARMLQQLGYKTEMLPTTITPDNEQPLILGESETPPKP